MNSLVPGVYARLRRVPFLYEINDDPFAPPSPGASLASQWRWHLQRRRDLLNLRWCTKAFVISPGLATRLMIACPDLDPNKLAILPSGANTELFAPLPPSRCRRQLGLAPSGRYVGFVGTLLSHQGIDVLIDAAAEMDTPPEGCTFVIIGEGPMRGPWQEAAARRGLGERFLFPGEVPYADVPTWLSAMDLCVAPYRRSAGLRSPVKIFDYLACGKPVVASQIPGTTDVFEGVPAVLLVAPEDPSALAMAIAQILGDTHRSHAMSAMARPFVQNGYDRRALARTICDGLRDMATAGRADEKHKER
jgi:glycosyltransferase involved in cell wall biosynthesis